MTSAGDGPLDPSDDRRATRDALTPVTVYLVALVAVPAPMVISSIGQVGGPATIVAIGLFLIWSWGVLHRAGTASLHKSHTRLGVAVYLVVMFITYAHSNALPLPADERSPADGALIRTVACAGVALLICDGFHQRDRLWRLVERVSIATGLLALLALVQVTTRMPLVDRITYPFLSSNIKIELEHRGSLVRPFGTATHPIEFAAMMAMALPLALAAAGRPGRRQGLHLAISVCVTIVVLITGSRTAILCGAVAVVAMLPAWRPAVRWIVAGVGSLLVTILFVLVPGFVGTVSALFAGAANDPSIKSRTNSYAIAESFIREQPLLGRGMGTFLPKYWIFDNQWIGVLVGAGALGLVALLWMIGAAVADSAVVVRSSAGVGAVDSGRQADRQLAVAGRAGVLTGVVALATFDAFSFAQATGMFFVMIGICGAARTVSTEEGNAVQLTPVDADGARQEPGAVGSSVRPQG